jgi:hypothetical protein
VPGADVHADSAVQLKAGDVIVAIDAGRWPEEQARRILRSTRMARPPGSGDAPEEGDRLLEGAGRGPMGRWGAVREGGPETMKFEVEKD